MYPLRKRLVAFCLLLAVLLAGCDLIRFSKLDAFLNPATIGVAYEDITYTRPDMEELEQLLEQVCAEAEKGTDLDAVVSGIEAYYEAYDLFVTNNNLACLNYYADLTDTYWEEEYQFCSDNYSAADSGLDTLYRALAKSPLRQQLESDEYFGADFFDAYEGEETPWDETYLALYRQETELLEDYYVLSSQVDYTASSFDEYGLQHAQLLVELIRVRQQMAQSFGFDSYTEYAYAYSYGRDYSPEQAEAFMTQANQLLGDLYRQVNQSDIFSRAYDPCSERETYRYLQQTAQAMGGDVLDAFNRLDEYGLCDISYGENKYDTAFELYLWSYYEPFIFMQPYGDHTDKLTLVHEFGHFVNDYLCYGSYAGMDVAEVHSQAMEYLSLCYGPADDMLTQYKLADSLCTYIECSAYAMFEHQAYALTGDDLTADALLELAQNIGLEYGFDSWGFDRNSFLMTGHFYTDPMYMFSYVISNDLALQFYLLEQEEAGRGLALYGSCLYSEDSYILTFAQQYGLEDPLASGHLQEVAQMFRESLE